MEFPFSHSVKARNGLVPDGLDCAVGEGEAHRSSDVWATRHGRHAKRLSVTQRNSYLLFRSYLVRAFPMRMGAFAGVDFVLMVLGPLSLVRGHRHRQRRLQWCQWHTFYAREEACQVVRSVVCSHTLERVSTQPCTLNSRSTPTSSPFSTASLPGPTWVCLRGIATSPVVTPLLIYPRPSPRPSLPPPPPLIVHPSFLFT